MSYPMTPWRGYDQNGNTITNIERSGAKRRFEWTWLVGKSIGGAIVGGDLAQQCPFWVFILNKQNHFANLSPHCPVHGTTCGNQDIGQAKLSINRHWGKKLGGSCCYYCYCYYWWPWVLQEKGTQTFLTTWMDLGDLATCELSQKQNEEGCLISCLCEI